MKSSSGTVDLLEEVQRTSFKVRVDRAGSRIVYNRQIIAYTAITSFAASLDGDDSRSNSPVPTPSHGVYGSADTNTVSKSGQQKKALKKARACNGDLALALTSTDPALVVKSCEKSYSMHGMMNGSFNSHRTSLNESQQRAVQAAMSRRLTLVQGPPGTGKTSMSTDIISKWVAGQRGAGQGRFGAVGTDKVFCGSDSNIAVDNLLEGLLKKGINAVRIGKPEGASPHLLKYCVEAMGKDAFTRAKEQGKMPNDCKTAKHMTQKR